MPAAPPITEVLVEPGCPQLWITFDTATHLVDLTPLLALDSHLALHVPELFRRARLTPEGIAWPGGAHLDPHSILQAPHGPQPVTRLALLPAPQRYRPLLPYLQHQLPPAFVQPDPIDTHLVQRLLGLRPAELDHAIRQAPAPPQLYLNRLYDLAVFLTEHFQREHTASLLRRPWRYALQQCPGQPLLHTMLCCLQHGRPDLIETPCLTIATGQTSWTGAH